MVAAAARVAGGGSTAAVVGRCFLGAEQSFGELENIGILSAGIARVRGGPCCSADVVGCRDWEYFGVENIPVAGLLRTGVVLGSAGAQRGEGEDEGDGGDISLLLRTVATGLIADTCMGRRGRFRQREN